MAMVLDSSLIVAVVGAKSRPEQDSMNDIQQQAAAQALADIIGDVMFARDEASKSLGIKIVKILTGSA